MSYPSAPAWSGFGGGAGAAAGAGAGAGAEAGAGAGGGAGDGAERGKKSYVYFGFSRLLEMVLTSWKKNKKMFDLT